MFRNQQSFVIAIVIFYIISLLVFTVLLVEKYQITDRLTVGNIFLNNKLFHYLVNLLYLDDFHSQLVLKEALPIVRVVDDNSIGKSEKTNSIIDFTFKLATDLPPSFFNINENVRVKEVINRAEVKYNQVFEEKLKAEGTHENEERVELDFWQTKASVGKKNQERVDELKKDKINFPQKYNRSYSNPVVGIYHTHTAENYDNRGYNARAAAGERGDVTLIGQELCQVLENKYGVPTIHSQTIHDKSYSKSYINSLYTAERIVSNNQDLKMIFDIHRDAIGKGSRDLITTTINGQKVAKIMIIVTNNKYGLPHPEWEKNVRFAKRLAQKMNTMYPGLLRDVKLISNRRYNQNVHPHALLLEVGGAKNSLDEAKRSTRLLAEVLVGLIDEGI